METAKKNAHPVIETNDLLDRFGKAVSVQREVRDGDFLHYVVNGVTVCDATWFELAKVCFTARRQQVGLLSFVLVSFDIGAFFC
jgi:hypothetical protein